MATVYSAGRTARSGVRTHLFCRVFYQAAYRLAVLALAVPAIICGSLLSHLDYSVCQTAVKKAS